MHAHTHTHACARTQTRAHTYTHTRTHTHNHNASYQSSACTFPFPFQFVEKHRFAHMTRLLQQPEEKNILKKIKEIMHKKCQTFPLWHQCSICLMQDHSICLYVRVKLDMIKVSRGTLKQNCDISDQDHQRLEQCVFTPTEPLTAQHLPCESGSFIVQESASDKQTNSFFCIFSSFSQPYKVTEWFTFWQWPLKGRKKHLDLKLFFQTKTSQFLPFVPSDFFMTLSHLKHYPSVSRQCKKKDNSCAAQSTQTCTLTLRSHAAFIQTQAHTHMHAHTYKHT